MNVKRLLPSLELMALESFMEGDYVLKEGTCRQSFYHQGPFIAVLTEMNVLVS
jgi:hypothetical protein